MNLCLVNFVFVVIFFSGICFFQVDGLAEIEPRRGAVICLAERIVKSLPSYGLSFENGVSMALMEEQKKPPVTVKKFFFDPDPMAPIALYDQLQTEGCDAVIGFSYLSDLLLYIQAQKNDRSKQIRKIPVLSPFASIDSKNKPENILTFNPSSDLFAERMTKFIKRKVKAASMTRPLIITEVNRSEMNEYRKSYDKVFAANGLIADHISIHENSPLPMEEIGNKISSHSIVVLLAGVVSSARIIDLRPWSKVIFLGTENFGSSTSMSLYLSLKNREASAYFIRNLDYVNGQKRLLDFRSRYESIYHVPPSILSAYAFDATKLLVKSLGHFNQISTHSILNTFYSGVSGFKTGNGRFLKSSSTSILQLTPTGYKLATEILNEKN